MKLASSPMFLRSGNLNITPELITHSTNREKFWVKIFSHFHLSIPWNGFSMIIVKFRSMPMLLWLKDLSLSFRIEWSHQVVSSHLNLMQSNYVRVRLRCPGIWVFKTVVPVKTQWKNTYTVICGMKLLTFYWSPEWPICFYTSNLNPQFDS